MDLKKKLKDGMGLPVAENCFISPPKPPYIIFIQDKDIPLHMTSFDFNFIEKGGI